MRRLFWVGVGAVGAVVVAQRVRSTVRRYTPEAVADQLEDAGKGTLAALQDAVTAFRTSSATRERDLVAALLVTPEGGDAGAVLRRKPAAAPASSSASTRPTGRVDDDEPLYDF